MTNEELALMIQCGERDRLMELWQQVRRMAMKQAHRWAVYGSGGVELEDLVQAAFIALMAAADTYDPAAGCAFTTWYYQHLTAAFTETTGRRTEKQRRDPLDAAMSLDTPVTQEDPEGPTLGDAIPDAQAAAAFQEAERRADNSRLRAALMGAVNTLPGEQRAAVVGKYWRNEKVNALALGKALRALRRPMISAGLRAYL